MGIHRGSPTPDPSTSLTSVMDPSSRAVAVSSFTKALARSHGAFLAATIAWALGLVVAVGALGFWLWNRESSIVVDQAARELAAIAESKARQIEQWRAERISDVRFLMGTPPLARGLAAYLEQPRGGSDRRDAWAWLVAFQKSQGFASVSVFDRKLELRLTTEDDGPSIASPMLASLERVGDLRELEFSDLHRVGPGARAHFDLVAPVLSPGAADAGGGELVGYVVFQITPEGFLYPLLAEWPNESASGETFLLGCLRTGAVYLYAPSGRDGISFTEASGLRPLETALDAGSFAVAPDERGVKSLAVRRGVAGTGWALLIKRDYAEVLAPLRVLAWSMGIFGVLLGTVIVLVASLLWRRRVNQALRDDLAAQQEQQQISARLDMVMRYANDIVLLMDADDRYRILDANEQAIRCYGYTIEELRSMRLDALRAPAEQGGMPMLTQSLDSAGQAVVETRHVRKDGSEFPVESSTRLSQLGGKRYLFSIVRDISERRAHAREIERLTRAYAVLSQVNEAISRCTERASLLSEVCRAVVQSGGFRMAWVGIADPLTKQLVPVVAEGDDTDYLKEVRIYADDQPLGRGPSGTAIREGRACVIQDLHSDPRSLPWREIVIRHHFRSAVGLPLRKRGQVVGAITVYSLEPNFFTEQEIVLLERAAGNLSLALDRLEDVQKRVSAEAALRESEARLQAIVDQAVTLVSLRGCDGRFLLVNRSVERALGRSRAEILGHHPAEFMEAAAAELHLVNDREVLERREPVIAEEYNDEPDGRHWYLTNKFPLFDANGEVYAVGCISADITERKRLDDALRRQSENLRIRNEELVRFNKVAVGRELRMVELKQEVNALSQRLGQPPPYPVRFVVPAPGASRAESNSTLPA